MLVHKVAEDIVFMRTSRKKKKLLETFFSNCVLKSIASPETHTHPQTDLWHPQAQIFLLSSGLLHLECETMRPVSFVCVISHRATIWPVRDQWGQTIDLTQRAPQGRPSGAVPGWVPSRLHALSISWQRSIRRAALWRSLPGDRGPSGMGGWDECLSTYWTWFLEFR